MSYKMEKLTFEAHFVGEIAILAEMFDHEKKTIIKTYMLKKGERGLLLQGVLE